MRVSASIGSAGSAVQDVVTFAADVGLIESPYHEPGLRVEPWLEGSLIVVATPDRPLASRTQVSCEALCRVRWLLRESGLGAYEEVSHAPLSHLYYLEDSLDLGSPEMVKHNIVAGLGISCPSRWVVEEQLAPGTLVELRSSLPLLHRRSYMPRQRGKFLSPGFEYLQGRCWAGLGTGQPAPDKKTPLPRPTRGGG